MFLTDIPFVAQRRHEYGDQNYLAPDDLKSSRWRELVFWHGHCRQGNPTLCILLGKAVQQLPAAELQVISSVISKCSTLPLTLSS